MRKTHGSYKKHGSKNIIPQRLARAYFTARLNGISLVELNYLDLNLWNSQKTKAHPLSIQHKLGIFLSSKLKPALEARCRGERLKPEKDKDRLLIHFTSCKTGADSSKSRTIEQFWKNFYSQLSGIAKSFTSGSNVGQYHDDVIRLLLDSKLKRQGLKADCYFLALGHRILDNALGFDGCLKDADWEVGYGPSCIVQTTDGLRCQEGIVRQRKGLKRMFHFTSRGCDVWCGEPSSLLQERAAMRLAAEVELDDRVLLRSRAKTGLKLRS
ncbi:hypothetical protein VNO80_35222 [Phaseolus coccineus]|uniref:Uncharacterized protein n=1 Tax=Phaseolus coccineus TaxID=3886 RepID=A0AAN9Q8N5_PHACN